MKLTEKRFIVIRRKYSKSRSKQKFYFDWHTLADKPLASQTRADNYDRKNEEYAKIHPQVRCVRVIVTVDPVPAGRGRKKK